MPPLTWLLQANMRDQAFRSQLAAELDRLGEEWHEVELIPFSDQIPALPFRASERLIICYGPSFVPRVALHTSWTPGIFFDAHQFRWSVMSERWAELTTAGAVLEALRSGSEPWFVRPDADSKLFDGGVYADASTFRHHLGSADLASPVIQARPLPVDAEWRCFIVGREVVDASEYRRAGRPSLHRGARTRTGPCRARAGALHDARAEPAAHRRGKFRQLGGPFRSRLRRDPNGNWRGLEREIMVELVLVRESIRE